MTEDSREKINDLLDKYTENHTSGCHASLKECGKLHLDWKFEIDQVRDILKIIDDNTSE